MKAQMINQIKNGDANVIVMLNAADLKEVVGSLYQTHESEREKAIAAQRERPTLTRQEAADSLNITLTTLWRWAKIGYLTPVKVGTKVLYRASDINALLTNKGVPV